LRVGVTAKNRRHRILSVWSGSSSNSAHVKTRFASSFPAARRR
jgi:hypothetical protein